MGSRSCETEVRRLLAHAETRGRCLATVDSRLRGGLVRLMRRGEVVRPARSVYARRAHWEGLSARSKGLYVLRALQELHPKWVFCSFSAALAYDLPIPFDLMGRAHVATSPRRRARATKGVAFRIVPDGEPVHIVSGIRVVPFERALLDCMRVSAFGRALALADAALRSGRASRERLLAYFRRVGRNLTGSLNARRTLRYADARSESAGESVARAAMIEQGFALPDLQVSFERPLNEGRSFRVDFLWMREDGMQVIGEFDGRVKYESRDLRGDRSALRVMEDERRRESQLSVYGMPIVRFSYRDVMDAAYFARLLGRFGIPRREEAAREHRRLQRSRSSAAKTFCVASF